MKKIKSSIKLLFTICFFSLSQILFSQESKLKPIDTNSKTSVKQNTTTDYEYFVKSKASPNPSNGGNVQKRVDTQGKSFQLDENDQYQGRKIEFLSQLTVKEIPADFPKYEKWMGVRHYNEIIDDYYRKHLDILQQGIKQKLSEH